MTHHKDYMQFVQQEHKKKGLSEKRPLDYEQKKEVKHTLEWKGEDDF